MSRTGLPLGATIRRDAGLWGFERALRRRGFPLIAGVDEAGRGACAGPLVIAACVLPEGPRGEVPGLADSKLLTEAARERAYAQVIRRALAYAIVVVEPGEVDAVGLHVSNVRGMRQAVARLDAVPTYILIDGFPVPGMPGPSLAVWKGDRVAGCVAAASVLAKVTRDRIMVELDAEMPVYGFKAHKGYNTPEHLAALAAHGPCAKHRRSFVTVRRAAMGGFDVRVGADQVGDDGAMTNAKVAVGL